MQFDKVQRNTEHPHSRSPTGNEEKHVFKNLLTQFVELLQGLPCQADQCHDINTASGPFQARETIHHLLGTHPIIAIIQQIINKLSIADLQIHSSQPMLDTRVLSNMSELSPSPWHSSYHR